MSRPLRLELPGALWHVTNRGVEQRNIYVEDPDRVRFLTLLENAVVSYGWQLLSYVLMSNHYHLLFQTPETNLSRGMKDLDGDYASWFNARHQRVGHLFQGRFKSHLVDTDAYLLEVARYIVLNPVRAGMVQAPGDWRWSSYRATTGLAPIPSWLDPAPILDRFDPDDRDAAMNGYRDFVLGAVGQSSSPWEALVGQVFLGRPAFLRDVEARIRAYRCSGEHPREQRMFRAVTIESVRAAIESRGIASSWPPAGSLVRAVFVLLCNRYTNATRASIGRSLGITGQAISNLTRIGESRMSDDPTFATLVRELGQVLCPA